MSEGGHIFISYARKDGQAQAERLEGALQARGYTTWRDTRGIDPAKDFTAEIERAIKAAEVVVTCITPDTERDDSFVRREIQYALVVKKRVIVARMAEIAPPIHVVNNTWVEFWKDWDAGFEHLLTVLNTPVENYNTPVLPPEAADPFRPYVQALYERTVDFLDRAVIRLIDLTAEETRGAVNVPPRQPSMIDLFFTAQGIKPHPQPLSNALERGANTFSTFAEAFEAYEGRVLLLGEPGAGKTITLMAFARDAAAKRLADPHAPLPLLGLISSWDAEKQTPLDDWLAVGVANIEAEVVKHEIERGKALLLLDGLDELGGEQEEPHPQPLSNALERGVKFDPRKRFMAQLPAKNQILVTCRVKDYEEIGQKIPLKGAVTLRPLDEGQMQAYLAEQPELWAAVQADAGLKEMLTTPLLLSFFAFAYRDDLDGAERQQLATFSDSPGDLRDKIFETYVRKRYEHEERKYAARGEAMPFTLEEIYEVLGKTLIFVIGKLELNTLDKYNFPNTFGKGRDSFLRLVEELHFISIEGTKILLRHELFRIHFILAAVNSLLNDDYWRLPALATLTHIGQTGTDKLINIWHSSGKEFTGSARIEITGILAIKSMYIHDKRLIPVLIEAVLNSSDDNPFSFMVIAELERFGTPEALEAVRVWREQQAGGGGEK